MKRFWEVTIQNGEIIDAVVPEDVEIKVGDILKTALLLEHMHNYGYEFITSFVVLSVERYRLGYVNVIVFVFASKEMNSE